MLQRIGLADRIRLERTAELAVEGFEDDTLVRRALELLAARGRGRAALAGRHRQADPGRRRPRRRAARMPLPRSCSRTRRLSGRAAEPGSTSSPPRSAPTFPFFLTEGPQLGEGDGTVLTALELPQALHRARAPPRGPNRRPRPPTSTPTSTPAAGRPATTERRAPAARGARRPETSRDLPPNDLARLPARRGAARGSAPFGPTSAGPGRPSTDCSPTRRPRRPRERGWSGSGAVWIGPPAW